MAVLYDHYENYSSQCYAWLLREYPSSTPLTFSRDLRESLSFISKLTPLIRTPQTMPSCILEKSELAINHAGVVEVLWNLPKSICAIMQNRAIPGKTQTATGREFGHGMGYSWKKLSRWREGTGLREFPGVMKKKHGNFHDMGLGISDGCHTILPNFLGRWKLVFSRISKGKVTNLKTPKGKQGGGGQKSISSIHPPTPHRPLFG